MRLRTEVAVIGAGPAGLVLANLLRRRGIACVVVERSSRAHVESRARAGVLEHRTAVLLRRHGLADGLAASGVPSGSCELRCGTTRTAIPYGELSGGRTHVVYPQQHLVRDLVRALDGDVLFSHPATVLSDGDGPVVVCRGPDGTRLEIDCAVVAGCDGAHGLTRRALPWRVVEHRYGFDWLTVLAESTSEGVTYSLHENGFAGRFPRTAGTSRFYLQCAAGASVEDWPDDRIRRELALRLSMEIGAITEKDVLELRACVVSPMVIGHVALLGDAAHLVTPAGAKGMNLAIADAVQLAEHIGSGAPLAAYSEARIGPVWNAVEFSDWMMGLISTPPTSFDRGLQLARMRRLAESTAFATAFSGMYVGVDE